ncbi:hypothetical protein NS226_07445 [Aureimonas ureilytica]|uniref:Uncharacterized protein n=1 Tax=Aureimonas ureilytica TaxID=401562 RepID=A0A175RAV3_9HYPH|nr:hypothetical protein [Aureimonas ureilytica]KTQ96419.1 hypothetical protein NS226_07445 [Aureimonas ureilytica]
MSRTVRIVHRPSTVWERNQDEGGIRHHQIAAYREVTRVFVHPRRSDAALPSAAVASEALKANATEQGACVSA